MQLDDFNYTLPPGLIAQVPLEQRDDSRLLVLDRDTGAMEHKRFRDVLSYLKPGDTIVMNNTRVFPARLHGLRVSSGGKVEVLLLKELEPGRWEALVKPGRRCLPGETLVFGSGVLQGLIKERTPDGGRIIKFNQGEPSLGALLSKIGEMPLPPYIRTKLADPERYQTVYGTQPGSTAAPTAGLHFTPELLAQIRALAVNTTFVTLDVGLGTFRPVRKQNIKAHQMHEEHYAITPETAAILNSAIVGHRRVIAVGTTVVRTLEAAGSTGMIEAGERCTDLFIYPGFQFKIVDALITNFHLPKSSLLMLVAAFAGYKNTMAAYNEAIFNQYRFFSFGDAMLII
ncbi:MAG TPA: tRNA preQ1(34) S-adenosylmethionine ribosyltransferase-isomerase QueA [bacterium]|nr:tRNA preQ1(34) S-adenosylmethionine ribosyltransferase-isomerase QueA [bacterium]